MKINGINLNNYISYTAMKRHLQVLGLILALTCLSSQWNFNNPYAEPKQSFQNQKVQYFNQILDHYNYQSTQYWKQRYYILNDFYSGNGPVFLYIGGQGTLNGLSATSWLANMAQQTNAIILGLEHRYYGESLPFRDDSFKLDRLKYLNSQQALKDLAYFIQYISKYELYGIRPSSKWISVGGSYPGALSAWFRSKYPHLTVGAISASGVIQAVEDFHRFDEQIFISANRSGTYCVEAIRQLTTYAEEKSLGEDRISFQSQFKAQNLTTREFMFYWSDVIVFQIQYGKRVEFCNSLKGKSLEERLKVVEPLMKAVSPTDYGAYYLKDAAFAAKNGGAGRSWFYQCCTEFSYFQTYSHEHPMRSKLLTLDFYRKLCEDIFGLGVWPAVKATNNEFGRDKIMATNLIMTNGIQDPWRWAGLQHDRSDIKTKVINCPDCAHCVDMRAPSKNDSADLKLAREMQLAAVKEWIK